MDADQVTDLIRPYLPLLAIQWLSSSPDERVKALEGTVVFVDISGFTKMSERLARHGKVGAEEVADSLGAVFTRMLAVAYGEGGSLLKFGGDALLLWFGGQGHVERSVRSAHGMRAGLREVGRLQTTAGLVTLRMSAGVHSGLFHLFLVGRGSHREFMISGPGASRTVEMEGTARAGEILLSPECAVLLPASVLGRFKGAGVLLRAAPKGLSTEAAELPKGPDADLALGVSLAVRGHIVEGAAEPEHRQVTVGFVHFDGFDAFLTERGAEAAASALDELVTDVQQAADAQRVTFLGTDVDHDGGKVILVSGAPRATGDDDERMLLTLHQVIERTRVLPVRIGVNRGHAFVGDVGPSYRRTYTVIGDAVNVAARVMAKAAPGELLSTGSVLARSATRFEERPLEPFMVKGKAKPVTAVALGGILGSRRVSEEGLAMPLVGRAAELAEIDEALGAAGRGEGRVVELVGPPGIGKTRLLAETVSRADGFRVVSAACDLYAASIPYAPVRRLLLDVFGMENVTVEQMADDLRAVVRDDAPQLERWIPLLAVPLEIHLPPTPEVADLDDKFRRAKLAEILEELLGALLPGPTLLTIEDAHWMDRSSVEVFTDVATHSRSHPWVLVLTRRDEETGFVAPEGSTVLRPPPLDARSGVDLARAMTEETPMLPSDIALLVERSGGNPLFLQRLVAAAHAVGVVVDLPDDVGSMVTSEIDRLAPADRRVLRLASVLGMRFEDRHLAALLDGVATPDDATWRRLSGFLEMEPDGWHRFSHPLMRDAAYDGLPFRTRKTLHARVGERIESEAVEPDEWAATLSMHFYLSDVADKAWHYSRIAGERAWWAFANLEAAEFLRRAMEAGQRSGVSAPELVEACELRGDALERANRFGQAIAAYRTARRIADADALATARLLHKEGQAGLRLGKARAALGTFRRALHAIEEIDGPEAAALRGEICVAYSYGLSTNPRRHAEALRWLALAEENGRASDSTFVLAHVAHLRNSIYVDTGRADLIEDIDLPLRLYEEIGRWGGVQTELINRGVQSYLEGDWDAAAGFYERGREIGERRGDAVRTALCTNNLGEIWSDQGRYDDAREAFSEAQRVWRAANYGGIPFATGNLGRLAAREGRHADAEELLTDARDRFISTGEELSALEMDVRRAENLILAGRAEEALAILDPAVTRDTAIGGWATITSMIHRLRGEALEMRGRRDEAFDAYREALRVGREGKADFDVALTLGGLESVQRAEGDLEGAAISARSRAGILRRLGVVRGPGVSPQPNSSTSP